jgi:hypothetical protein
MRRIAGSVSLALALAACAVPLATAPDTGSAAPLRLVRPTDLCVTEGRVHALAGERMEVTAPAMRAVVAGSTSEAAELAFVYQGPASGVKPLASGEVRRQIGLKLRAQDTCNVVYVMWRVEPASKIAVQVKRNPGKRRHAECRAIGSMCESATTIRIAT